MPRNVCSKTPFGSTTGSPTRATDPRAAATGRPSSGKTGAAKACAGAPERGTKRQSASAVPVSSTRRAFVARTGGASGVGGGSERQEGEGRQGGEAGEARRHGPHDRANRRARRVRRRIRTTISMPRTLPTRSFSLVLAAFLWAPGALAAQAPGRPVPVILDTDIGDDIDDTWALALALKSPELDVKLVVTDFGNTEQRAKLVARVLELAGRTDIPIGIGVKENDEPGPQAEWVKGYDLAKYPGRVLPDGVQALDRHRHGVDGADDADRHRPAPEPEGRARARAADRREAAPGRHVRQHPPAATTASRSPSRSGTSRPTRRPRAPCSARPGGRRS